MSRLTREDALKTRYTVYAFKGSRGWPHTIHGSAFTDKGATGYNGENISEFRISGAGGVVAGPDQKHPTHVYIRGTDNYDGIRQVYNVRSARWPQIFAPFVAETPAGAFCHAGYKAEVASELGGFSYHIDTPFAPQPYTGTLEIVVYSAKGAAFDNKVYSKNVGAPNYLTSIKHMFTPPRYLAPGDRVDIIVGGIGTIGALLYIRKLA